VADLLTASHIIPWSASEPRRADPRNGLCLNALHDRAFDRGLLTFDEYLRAVVSPLLKTPTPPPLHATFLLQIESTPLRLPSRFEPDAAALAWHREVVFRV
jgi:predicted restriction endonuclease